MCLEGTEDERHAFVAGGFGQFRIAHKGGDLGPVKGEPGMERYNEEFPVDGTICSGSRKSVCKHRLAPSPDDDPEAANRALIIPIFCILFKKIS